jgi:hypothetical protein
MMVKGLVVRTGVPLPPAAGPARVKFVHREGVAAFRKSCRLYGQVLMDVGINQLGDISKLPTWIGLRNGPLSEADERNSITAVRLRWQQVREDAEQKGIRTRYPQVAKLLADMPNGADWESMADTARRALRLAVDAYNFLEDDPLAEFAHIYAHQVAAFVCGMFGCTFTYEDDVYWDSCTLSLMHNRVGHSMGFTANRVCSICYSDIEECPHLLDQKYPISAERDDDGRCTACGASSCPHTEGETVEVYPKAIFGDDMELHEISYVGRPRDPLARLTQVEVDKDLVIDLLGHWPDGNTVYCYRCLQRCSGIKRNFEDAPDVD